MECSRTGLRESGCPVNRKGQKQAEKLAEKVSELQIPVTKIIHSPLQRAKDTAQAVADKLHLPMEVDERLIEMDLGIRRMLS